MAFRCKQYIVELEAAVDNTVLMQELQDQADLGCVKPGTCISINEVLASNIMGAVLNCTFANATKRGRLRMPRLPRPCDIELPSLNMMTQVPSGTILYYKIQPYFCIERRDEPYNKRMIMFSSFH